MNSFHRDILNVKPNTPGIGGYKTILKYKKKNTHKTYYKVLCNPKPLVEKKRN